MVLSKKAQNGTMQVVMMVLAIIILGVALYFVYRALFGAKNAANQCPGICIEKGETCTFPRTAQGFTCSINGKAGTCCASILELAKKQDGNAVPSTDNNADTGGNDGTKTDNNANTGGTGGTKTDTNAGETTTGSTSQATPKTVIQIRFGYLTGKINTGSPIKLYAGKTSTYYLWGEGTNASTCSYDVIDEGTAEHPAADTGMNLKQTDQPCKVQETVTNLEDYLATGGKGIIKIDFKPTVKVVGHRYEFDTYLKNSKGDLVQKTTNEITVVS